MTDIAVIEICFPSLSHDDLFPCKSSHLPTSDKWHSEYTGLILQIILHRNRTRKDIRLYRHRVRKLRAIGAKHRPHNAAFTPPVGLDFRLRYRRHLRLGSTAWKRRLVCSLHAHTYHMPQTGRRRRASTARAMPLQPHLRHVEPRRTRRLRRQVAVPAQNVTKSHWGRE